MKKERFYELLQDPEKITSKDLRDLKEMVSNAPFFTTARTLSALGNISRKNTTVKKEIEDNGIFFHNLISFWDLEDLETKKDLSEDHQYEGADVSTAILEVLPDILPGPSEPLEELSNGAVKIVKDKPRPAHLVPKEDKAKDEAKTREDKKVIGKPSEESHDVSDDVMESLQSLRETLKNLSPTLKPVEKAASTTKKPTKQTSTQEEKATSKVLKPNRQALKKIAPPTLQKKGAEVQKKVSSPKTRKRSTPKPKENVSKEIIEQFIKNQPSIKPAEKKGGSISQEDLSKNSIEENKLLVSENLAKILTKQNKLDKAREVYNLLILKYPEKKSYFAAQLKKLEE